jgi:hypothetical protein
LVANWRHDTYTVPSEVTAMSQNWLPELLEIFCGWE